MSETKIDGHDALLKMAEVAKLLKTDKSGVRRLERRGLLGYIQLNARVKLYRLSEVYAMLSKLEVKAS